MGEFSYRRLDEDAAFFSEPPAELTGCPDCNGPVAEVRWHVQFIEDLPPPRPVLHRLVTYSGWCPCCTKRVRSRHPLQTSSATGAAGVVLGPRVIALSSDMKHRFGVSYDKIAEFLLSAYGLKVTGGALLHADQRLARRARPVYETLTELIRLCMVVHVDETGWRIGQLSAWLWVFTNQRITLLAIRAGPGARGHEVILSILGREFAGTLVADGFLAYDARALADWIHQKCLGHILKNLKTMSESRQAATLAVASEATEALRAALALRDERGALDAAAFAARRAVLASIVVTLRKNDVDVHAYLTAPKRDAAPAIATLIKPVGAPATAR